MNKSELNVAVARLLGWKIEYSSDRRKVKVTRPDGSVVMPPFSVTGWCDVDVLDGPALDYGDLNAAVEACLELGYAPKIRPAGWGDYSVGLRKKNDWVSEHIPLVTNDLEPQEITQAIATALCEALVEAEGEK